jgi:hypothetical protein
MTANGNGDAAIAKRVQNRKKALAGNAEDMLDAIYQELIDQRRGTGSVWACASIVFQVVAAGFVDGTLNGLERDGVRLIRFRIPKSGRL